MVQGEPRDQQQQFRADQHKVGDVKGKKSTHQLNPELMWPWDCKGRSMLGKKLWVRNDPPGLDSATLPGAADPPV